MKITPLICMLLSGFYPLLLSSEPKKRLIDSSLNIYSQFGEDGIVKKIFEIMGTTSKIAVEFGAWDGFHLSNTAALWSTDISWKGVLIEGDKERFKELKRNTAFFNVLAINEWVGINQDDCLEAILEQYGITQTIDLLSIDVDGNDYHIFNSLKTMRPRLIICEYNPTIPVTYDVYAPYCADNNFGQSVGALNRIAQKKGYALVALTVTNAFYILQEDFYKFAEYETDVRLLDVNDGYITLVTTYDGKYALIKNKKNNYFYGIDKQFEGNLHGDIIRWDNLPLILATQQAAYKK